MATIDAPSHPLVGPEGFGVPESLSFGLEPAFVTFTQRLSRDLGALAAAFDRGTPGESVAQAAVRRWPAFRTFLDARLDELADLLRPLTEDAYSEHCAYFRAELASFTAEAAVLQRSNTRPRGYAGDSELMRMLHDTDYRGDTVLGALLHHHATQTKAAEAVRHRAGLVADLLAARRATAHGKLRVLSLACGPARELRALVQPSEKDLEIILADQDAEALAEARDEIALVERLRGCKIGARTEQLSVRDVLRGRGRVLGSFDIVYSLGLFDYLPKALATKVVTLLTERLASRGVLVVSNFHSACKTRAYLDAWMDWPLLYRDEADMIDLASEVGAGFLLDVDRDPTGSEMYLRVWSNDRRA